MTFVVFPTETLVESRRQVTDLGVAVITSATPRVVLGRLASRARLHAIRGEVPELRRHLMDDAWLAAQDAVTCEHVFTQQRWADEAEGVTRIRTVLRVVDVTATAIVLRGVSEQRLSADGAVVSSCVPHVGAPIPAPIRLPRALRARALDEPAAPPAAATAMPARPDDPPPTALATVAALALIALTVLGARRAREPASRP